MRVDPLNAGYIKYQWYLSVVMYDIPDMVDNQIRCGKVSIIHGCGEYWWWMIEVLVE